MAAKGVEAVKVEVLARQLEVSKGSFYWHFKNRDELLEAILQRWEEQTEWLIEQSQLAATPKERLFKLFALAEEICQQPDPEPAIFLWAKKVPAVQKRVHALENKRVNYLAELLTDYGFETTEARQRAEVAYLALMGFADRQERDSNFEGNLGEFSQFLLFLLLSPLADVQLQTKL
ncbi:transcriptional regulator [Stanieria sp. NIES-3757]|nr:transcriptional regulator [Stanieria sp. NIES-3757]